MLQLNFASFILGGRQVDISAKRSNGMYEAVLRREWVRLPRMPNRDSVLFRSFYDISEAETAVRESFRYGGNPMFI